MAGPDPLTYAKALLGVDATRAVVLAETAHRHSSSPEATLLLAAARRRTGDLAGALALLAPLARALPAAWGVQFEHGIALAADGNTARAIEALARATALNPRATLVLDALEDLRSLTYPQAADERLAIDPALDAAAIAFLDGDEAARALLLKRFGLATNDCAAAALIAQAGLRGGRYRAVADLMGAVSTIAPRHGPTLFRHAEALHRAERDHEALVPIETLLADTPGLLAARSLRAAILMRLGREAEAADELAAVTCARPDDAGAWLAYGHALRFTRRRDDALVAYRRSIRAAPTFGEAYWAIADLKTASFAPDELAAMTALLTRSDLSAPARSQIEFALGRAREDTQAYEAAFAHYRRGGAIRRSIAPYDAQGHAAFVRRSIASFDRNFFEARAGWGDPSVAPIFVVGMPRSGSSLVEQILASHSQVEGLAELPEVTTLARGVTGYPEGLTALSAEEAAALGTEYLARVRPRRSSSAPRFVDKFPGNVFHLGLILLMLPNARIIDVRRDARDCCVSLFAQNFAAGQAYSYDLRDLGQHYASYVELTRHIDAVRPGRVLRVGYEALVEATEQETRRLLDHVGLAFEPQCLRFFDNMRAVRTASSEQVRQPIYRRSIGRWKRFEPWLAPLLDSLSACGVETMVSRE